MAGLEADIPGRVRSATLKRNRSLTFLRDGGSMNDSDVNSLMMAASERQLAVAALQKKYEQSESVPTEQLVRDMRELLFTERVVLDAIITLFVKLGHDVANP